MCAVAGNTDTTKSKSGIHLGKRYAIVGAYALLAAGTDGIFIVDIRDSTAPRLVAERHDPYMVTSHPEQLP